MKILVSSSSLADELSIFAEYSSRRCDQTYGECIVELELSNLLLVSPGSTSITPSYSKNKAATFMAGQ
jgi:hypothetical protein